MNDIVLMRVVHRPSQFGDDFSRSFGGQILFRHARNATLVTVTHDHTVLDRFDRVIDFQELAA